LQTQSANYFNSKVQAFLSKDLPSLMHGKLPAAVSVEMTSYVVGPDTFQSPTTTVTGVLKISDATSGAIISQTEIQADDSEMTARRNRDPLAAAAAGLLLSAVIPIKEQGLNNLAAAFRIKVHVALGGSEFF
jgi:hypothetical protein